VVRQGRPEKLQRCCCTGKGFESGAGISLLLLERTGGTTSPGTKRISKTPKEQHNSAICKAGNNAKAEETYCRQEDREEPSDMTSGCHIRLARYSCCKAALHYQEELRKVTIPASPVHG